MQSHKFGFADALRGPAALCVVASHLLYRPEWADTLGIIGQVGVGVFFLVSGFVIPFSLMKYDSTAFMIARVLRIYPTYAAALTITIATLWLSAVPLPDEPLRYIANYLIVGTIAGQPSFDNVVWTLEIELQFYLLCVLVAPLIRSLRLEVLAVPSVLFLVRFAAPAAWLPLFRLSWSIGFLILMFGGVATFYFVQGKISATVLALYVAACCGLCLLTQWLAGAFVMGQAIAFIAAACLFLAALFLARDISGGFFSKTSYSLYVAHPGVGPCIERLIGGGWLGSSVAFAACVAVATALHFAVEAPTHRLGQRISRSAPSWRIQFPSPKHI